MELEKDMYILANGEIDKILCVVNDENNYNLNRVYCENGTYFIDDIEKYSFNINDLLKGVDNNGTEKSN